MYLVFMQIKYFYN